MPLDPDIIYDIEKKAIHDNNYRLMKACNILLSLNFSNAYVSGTRDHNALISGYPPAERFGKIGEAEIFSSGNKENKMLLDDRAALYVHMPFRPGPVDSAKGNSTRSILDWSEDRIGMYIDYLKKELMILGSQPYMKKKSIEYIYLGGGVPTLLEYNQIRGLIDVIKKFFNISRKAHLAFKVTPNTMDDSSLEAFHREGFNYLSIRAQTFDNRLLKSYGRLYTSQDTIEGYNRAKSMGFANINIDVVFGLKGQTLNTWDWTLDMLSELDPADVSYFPYNAKPSGDEDAGREFPTPEGKTLMHIMILENFIDKGYIHVHPYRSVINWRFPYFQEEQGSLNSDVYGVGTGTRSFINNCYFSNMPDLNDYMRAIDENMLPVECGVLMTKNELMRKYAVMSLLRKGGINRMDGGIDKLEFKKTFGVIFEDVFTDTLDVLEQAGFVDNIDKYVRFSYPGVLFSADIARLFYQNELPGNSSV